MHVCTMKIQLVTVLLLCGIVTTHAQTEMGDGPETTKRWSMLSFQYTQIPQFGGHSNTGFGFNFFFNPDDTRRFWPGVTMTITGVGRRNAVMIGGGGGAWIVGTGRLGVFSYAATGMSMSSTNGLTGFGFFTDPSLSFGWASQFGIGGCIELLHNVRIHLTGTALHFSNEQGATPLGVQIGITMGGR